LEMVFYIVVSVLSLIGLMTAIRFAAYHFFSLNTKENICEIICLFGEDSELALRSAISQIEWQAENKHPPILAVDLGLDADNLKICRKICSEYGIQLCNNETLISNLMNFT
jgi:hypothetical protein